MANVLGTLFQNIADAIREKTGESGSMKPADFPAEIRSISTVSNEGLIVPETTCAGFVLDENYGAYTPGFVTPSTFALVDGDEYRIEWDGTSYTCTATSFDNNGTTIVYVGNGTSIGQAGNDEPFMITYNETDDNTQMFSSVEGDSHTVQIWRIISSDVEISEFGTFRMAQGSVTTKSDGSDVYRRIVYHGLGQKPDFVMVILTGAMNNTSDAYVTLFPLVSVWGLHSRFKSAYPNVNMGATYFTNWGLGDRHCIDEVRTSSNNADIYCPDDYSFNFGFRSSESGQGLLCPGATYKWVAFAGMGGGMGGSASAEGTYPVTFCLQNGTVLYERRVYEGDDCPDPIAQGKIETPTKASTAQYDYTFSGWSRTLGGSASDTALKEITAQRVLYAAYAATVRQYTVRFFDGETLLASSQVSYNTCATPPDTVREGLIFVGWDRDPATTPITGDTDFYGTWQLDEGWLAYRGTLTGLTGTASYSSGADANYVYDIRYTPDGTRMVAATSSNLYLYDATTTPYTLLTTKSTGTSSLQTGIDISPDGTELALCYKNKSTSVSNSLKFYSLADDTLTYKSSASGTLGTSSVLYAPRYSHDGTKVAVWANESKGVAVFERSGSWTLAADIATTSNIYLNNEIYKIDLAFSPDDTVLSAVCGYSYQYVAHKLFDMTSYTDITGAKSVAYKACKYRTAFHPSGDYLLIGGEKATMGTTTYNAIYQITLNGEGAANERTCSYSSFNPTVGATSDIAGMEFGPTGKVILLTHLGLTPTLHGYLTDTWEKLEAPSTMPDGYGRSLAISPDGKVAVGTDGGKVFTYQLWE